MNSSKFKASGEREKKNVQKIRKKTSFPSRSSKTSSSVVLPGSRKQKQQQHHQPSHQQHIQQQQHEQTAAAATEASTAADEFVWIDSHNRLVELQQLPWTPSDVAAVAAR